MPSIRLKQAAKIAPESANDIRPSRHKDGKSISPIGSPSSAPDRQNRLTNAPSVSSQPGEVEHLVH
jgi:hypothetical protein